MTNTTKPAALPSDSVKMYAVVARRDGDVEDMFLTLREAYAEIKELYDLHGFRKGSRHVVPGFWSSQGGTWHPIED